MKFNLKAGSTWRAARAAFHLKPGGVCLAARRVAQPTRIIIQRLVTGHTWANNTQDSSNGHRYRESKHCRSLALSQHRCSIRLLY